jgi:hypothetical protein
MRSICGYEATWRWVCYEVSLTYAVEASMRWTYEVDIRGGHSVAWTFEAHIASIRFD